MQGKELRLALEREVHEFDARVDAELAERAADVRADGVRRQKEPAAASRLVAPSVMSRTTRSSASVKLFHPSAARGVAVATPCPASNLETRPTSAVAPQPE